MITGSIIEHDSNFCGSLCKGQHCKKLGLLGQVAFAFYL